MRSRRRLLCEQRGAISVLAGLSLVVVVASTALSVDIGKEAWQKRSLQKTVDVISLDAVRAVGDRKDSLVDPYTKAVEYAQESATRNNYDYANTAAGNSLTVELGIADGSTKTFTVAAPADYGIANAVRITATTDVPFNFMPGTAHLTTQAIAMTDPEATFSIGSRLVGLDTTTSPILNSVLGGMLGGAVNLSAVGYNGLLAASVRLGDVWTNLGLGSASQILNTQVGVQSLASAAIAALNNQGDPASLTAATTLGTFVAQIANNAKFKFGDLLDLISGDPGAAADAKVDVLKLIGAASTLANGTNLLNLTVPITIPGVTTTTLKLGVIEHPRFATGPARKDGTGAWVTRAHTAQVRAQLDLSLTQKLQVLLSQGTVHLPVYVESAGATGELTAVQCAIPKTDSHATVHTTTSVVTGKIGTATDDSLHNPAVPADVRPGQIVSITGLVNVTGTATASMPASVSDLLVQLYQTLGTGGGSSVALSGQLLSSLALSVQVLGVGVNGTTVANNTLAIINPVLSTLDSTLLTPLKKALGPLGLEIGGADVTNHDTGCGRRRLIG